MKFWNALLAVMFVSVLSSCASLLKNIDSNVAPDGNVSVVVGRLLITHDDGSPLQPKPSRGYIIYHISPYTGIENLNTNPIAPGEFAVKAKLNEDGYFAIPLPAGKYYVVEYLFGYQFKLYGFRPFKGSRHFKDQKRWITTFDVIRGKATYIGTIKHQISTYPGTEIHSEVWNIRMQITDDSTATREWFRKTYPNWSDQIITSLATAQTLN